MYGACPTASGNLFAACRATSFSNFSQCADPHGVLTYACHIEAYSEQLCDCLRSDIHWPNTAQLILSEGADVEGADITLCSDRSLSSQVDKHQHWQCLVELLPYSRVFAVIQ